MKRNTQVLLLFLVGGALLVAFIMTHPLCVEQFGTSPGTMVQLQTSHVPTQEDVDYFNFVLPKIVRKEITSMTGEDPGEIRSSEY